MAPPAEDPHEALDRILGQLEKDARSQWKAKRFHRRLFEWLNMLVGLPAAVLAGAATISALKDARPGLVAALAGAATVLGTAQVFLRSTQRAGYNRTLEAEFRLLASDARRLREIELPLHRGDNAWLEKAAARLEKYDARFATFAGRPPLEE